ncbi:hypothetical protein N0V88_006578 [Collariella sp. IMI 366227]|nr:hypothetical protein N0V88_006578 [Collariella sp. IMI 366227]
MRLLTLLPLLSAVAPGLEATTTPYQLRKPPLDTPWTSKVGTNPWPQYPRPQLRRDAWHSLNGIWTYQPSKGANNGTSVPTLPLGQEVLIPSCIESGISGLMVMDVTHMWFGTKFTVPKGWKEGQRVLMNFEAVDYEATVYVNGAKVGFNRGGYNRFSLDVTDHLKKGENDLHVFVFDPTDDQGIPLGKQTRRPSHIFYTPCTGIWQTVWLESVPENYIKNVDISADMHGKVTVTVNSHKMEGTPVNVHVEGIQGGDTCGRISAKHQHVSDKAFTFNIDSPKLWSPSSPTLYNVTVTMGSDEVKSYTGFRTISSGVVNGIKRPLLNGKFEFIFGPLDQGYWPDGLHTPPTLEAMVYDLEIIKKLGMNMVRKHIKIEPDLFYEACDRLGLLVIQDMPSMRAYTRTTEEDTKEFERQLEIMIHEHKSYPSIITWVIYNEGWGQIITRFPEFGIADRIREIDPTRLIDAVTGWHDHGAGDYHDNHHYADPQCGTPFFSLPNTLYDPARIGFQGEFGGIGHRPADANLWPVEAAVKSINETYEIHSTLESYHYRAHVLLDLLRQQVERYACSGAVYTQTTDVEGEVNGLMTYDRRVVRVDVEQWRRDIRRLYEAAEDRS